MKKVIGFFLVTALCLGLAACARQKGGSGEDITIGAVYNLSGSQSNLDIPSAQGALAAVKEINSKGGLLGKQLALSVEDGQSDVRVIAEKTAKLIEEFPAVPGIVGLSDTDMVLAAAPVAARHRRVFLTSGATSPQLPQQVPDYLYLACFGDNVQAAVGAEWAYAGLGVRDVLILYNQDSTYSRLLQGYFRTRFEELGGHIVATQVYSPDRFSALALKPGKFDLIYLAATPEEVLPALAQLRKAGVSVPVLGGDGLDIGSVWQQGREFSNVYFTTHAYLGKDNKSPKVEAFRASFARAYPNIEPDAFTALGFDTVSLLAEAIRRAGSTQPDAVRHALSEIQGYAGITGHISYLSGSQIPVKSVSIIKVNHGSRQLVGEYLPFRTPEP